MSLYCVFIVCYLGPTPFSPRFPPYKLPCIATLSYAISFFTAFS